MKKLNYNDCPEFKDTVEPSYTGELKAFFDYYDKEKLAETDYKKMEYGVDTLRFIKFNISDERKFVIKSGVAALTALMPMCIIGSIMPDSPAHYASSLLLFPAGIYAANNALKADRAANFIKGIKENNRATFESMIDKVHAMKSLESGATSFSYRKRRK